MSKVFVLGGTGFLGYYTVKELLSRGYQVKTMSLPPLPAEDLFPAGIEASLGNMNDLSDEEIITLLSDCEGFVYAAGADERTTPAKPALKFFYEVNVRPTQRIARLASQAGVKKFVVFGSYFSEFAERWPQYQLKKQGYPNTRLLQEQVAFAEGEGTMTVTALRLPYIFGTMPGRVPLWKMFTDQVKGQATFPVLSGGTAMVTVEQVAEAAIGALEKGEHRTTYAICSKNMKFKEFYQMIIEALGQTETTQLIEVPYEQMQPIYEEIDQQTAAQGKEHGIHIALSTLMQTQDLYLDPQETMPVLGIKEHDVVASIRTTLAKCVE